MKTPIADFVKKYAESGISRFHMPGHKGEDFLGCEKLDITEIFGADVLSSGDGIIYESEKNASALFQTGSTLYSTEGSTAVICAMLSLVRTNAKERPLVLAARNVHKAFVHACALLDLDVGWIMSQNCSNILKCEVTAQTLQNAILGSTKKPAAVYLTSPDYLGNIQNIPEIAKVCKKHDIPLLVDNAHGAYLGFLKETLHPIHLGATACCDSAHKTLPVLTGGAYLHISKDSPANFFKNARSRLALFSSTSPSYLILQSLDLCNKYLADGFEEKLAECISKINLLKDFIACAGFCVLPTEPLKITIDAATSGYTGYKLAEILRENKLEPEFYDKDFLVLMCTPQNLGCDFDRLINTFAALKPKTPIERKNIAFFAPLAKMTIREAVLSDFEEIDVSDSVERICAAPTVSCPPAVPIAISGEIITDEIAELFKLYGTHKIKVVK